MSNRLGIVMNAIDQIKIAKDSSFAMLLEAQRRGYQLVYMRAEDIWLSDGTAMGRWRALQVADDAAGWFDLGEEQIAPLAELDVILMRKDPPFDSEYVYDTYVLERAEAEGVQVVNRPQALRDANEKAFTAWFPQCAPPTLITRDARVMREFVKQHGDAVIKPLDGMGGTSIFRVGAGDLNLNVVIETVSNDGERFTVAQRYVPEINAGDKRLLLIDGVPIDYALARVPPAHDFRGNLAKGGTGHGVELSDRDRWICEQVGPELSRRGIWFAGLDVIGDYLTEINVTSPTCIRELDAQYGLNIAGDLFDCLERLRAQPGHSG